MSSAAVVIGALRVNTKQMRKFLLKSSSQYIEVLIYSTIRLGVSLSKTTCTPKMQIVLCNLSCKTNLDFGSLEIR